MRDVWRGIDGWLAVHAPFVVARLADGAAEDQVAMAEASLGARFPAEFRSSLDVHDGEAPEEAWLFGSHSLLPLQNVTQFWRQQGELLAAADPDDLVADFPAAIRPVFWSVGWIPFAYDGAGGYLHLDLDPTPAGVPGQVIQTTSDGEYRLVASGFRAFLDTFSQYSRAGAFEVVDDGLEPKSRDNHWWTHPIE